MQRIAQARRRRVRLSLRSTRVARKSGLPEPQIAFPSGTYIIRALRVGIGAIGGLLNPADSTRRRQVAGSNRGKPMQVEPPKHHFVPVHNVVSSNSSNRLAMQNLMPRLSSRLGKVLFAALLSLQASYAAALGLGEIDLDSALNEKLRAEIGLIDASGLESSEILVSLASSEDFERVGVERFFFLTDLKFDVAVDSKGQPVIRVRSGQAISEPYLNFIVEVLWPSGRLLKEFTLLLDPPTFTQAAAPAVSAPARSTASTAPTRSTRPEPARSAPRTSSRTAAPRTSSASSAAPVQARGEGEILTTRNDTLWNIAQQTLPATDISVEQNMLALKRKNPKAFIRDNVNLMKAGYVLRTPTTNEAQQLSVAEAKARVAAEHEAWRTGRNLPSSNSVAADDGGSDLKAQVDATAAGSNTKPAATNEGQLRIVAGDGDSTQGAKDTAAAGTSLAASAEEQDRLSREVEELNYKLDREAELAANQLTVKERQLEVKDQEIAELQASVEALREQYKQAVANQGANPASAEPLAWWQAPWVVLTAIGGALLMAIWALFAGRRKSAAAAADEAYYEQADLTESVTEPSMDAQGAAVAVAEPGLDDLDADTEVFTEDMSEEFEDEQSIGELAEIDGSDIDEDDFDLAADDEVGDDLGQTSDVIGEADIYIAYGRYPQAISLLLGALEADPDRHDVRCKLLQLYSETNDSEAFGEHMQELTQRCDDPDILTVANELKVGLESDELDMGVDADVGVEVAADAVEEVADIEAGMDEFQLELDDDSLTDDLSSELDSAGLDNLATEFDDMAEATPELDELTEDLGGDLGMDFDPEVDVVPELTDNADSDVPQLDDSASAEESSGTDFSNTDLDDDEFDFSDSSDSASTKLDLARAYIDMGDQDGARDILGEVLVEGNDDQQRQANELLENI